MHLRPCTYIQLNCDTTSQIFHEMKHSFSLLPVSNYQASLLSSCPLAVLKRTSLGQCSVAHANCQRRVNVKLTSPNSTGLVSLPVGMMQPSSAADGSTTLLTTLLREFSSPVDCLLGLCCSAAVFVSLWCIIKFLHELPHLRSREGHARQAGKERFSLFF